MKYQVLREAKQTVAVTVVARTPEEAVRKAYAKSHDSWKPIEDGMGLEHIDTVTEQREGGKAYSVEYRMNNGGRWDGGGRCVEEG